MSTFNADNTASYDMYCLNLGVIIDYFTELRMDITILGDMNTPETEQPVIKLNVGCVGNIITETLDRSCLETTYDVQEIYKWCGAIENKLTRESDT